MSGKSDVSLDALLEQAPEAAEFMRQFSNANRLMLLCHIAGKERSVSDIQGGLGIKQPALSQQLAELRQSGLVKTRRESRTIYYSIADGRTKIVMDMLYQMFCAAPGATGPDVFPGSSLAQEAPAGLTRAPNLPPIDPQNLSGAAHFARLDSVE
ncbi:ArsR/SmtB family transcription factor [Rhizobium giardinii]|uniref:DNA-binding transcriptional ArsR family regulator n=1 Tax=Rhizobium giardinii TaxID=56731 RepID=A0A7W8UFG0_9HYPH|nr:metalloregulator ArsR/SmtB family transcription factor [Rhizobium giardinii]MBB5537180.1 DNA-binding transcriptional ArsR family regulator [Rhizobium giardinii]